MFRWCSYCQRLMGEKAPFDDYRISHGVCESCVGKIDGGEVFPVRGLDLFKKIFETARRGDRAACRGLVDEALGWGWRPSDVAVGLLQPMLYEIGRLWAEGKIAVSEERAVTAWCKHVMTILEERSPLVSGPLRVLLCLVDGNAHNLGPWMTALYLRDRGIAARAVLKGLPENRILDLCRREKPELLGLSVALKSGLGKVRAIVKRAASLPHPPRVIVGGLAARLPEAAEFTRAFAVEDILIQLGGRSPRVKGGGEKGQAV